MRERKFFWLCLAIALGLRLGVAVLWWNRSPVDDERAYEAVALSILGGRGFSTLIPIGVVNPGSSPTSLWGCLQPLYIAAHYAIFGPIPGTVYLSNAVLGLVPIVVAWRLSVAIAGQREGLAAASWLAIDPHLIKLSASLMTEPLYIACLWLGIDRVVAWRRGGSGWNGPAWAGALLGLASLSRAVAFPFAVLALLWCLLEVRGNRRTWREAAVFSAALATTLAPWVARNSLVHERPVFLDTKTGWNLYIYFHPEFDAARGNQVPLPVEVGDRLVSESRRSEMLARAAFDFALSDPWRLVRQAPAKLWRLWSPVAGVDTDDRLARIKLGYLVPLELLAISGIVRWNWRLAETRALLVALAYFAALHTMIPGGPRFRAPLDPVLAVFAGVALRRSPRTPLGKSVSDVTVHA